VGLRAGLDTEATEKKNRLTLPGIEPQSPGRPVHSQICRHTRLEAPIEWLILTVARFHLLWGGVQKFMSDCVAAVPMKFRGKWYRISVVTSCHTHFPRFSLSFPVRYNILR
jgi:hypothetical protein